MKGKCRDFVLAFWKSSVANKDRLHVRMSSFLLAPEQHKLFPGAVSLLEDVLSHLQESGLVDLSSVESGLGLELDKLVRMVGSELTNKSPLVRKVCTGMLVKASEIAAAQTDTAIRRKIVASICATLKPLKPAAREKLVEQLNKAVSEEIKHEFEEKAASPEKGPEEDKSGGLIYAEPLSAELKTELRPMLQYFSEIIVQCLHSQNWASRSAGLLKVLAAVSP